MPEEINAIEEVLLADVEDTLETPEALEDHSEAESAPRSPDEEIDALREEISTLKKALADKEQEQQKAMRDLHEFNTLYPEKSVKDIPADVWRSVEEGVPLSAAYALYERKNHMDRFRAEQINMQNAARSAGVAGKDTASEYFSPDEVRAMSQKQVHDNYKKIVESMKRWNRQ